eukprot:CAMPEP_0117696078 /NCGR_PEP_ID=MMETSP0804-20121206/28489_1 /TAXON_ID=1074897 /ORGANISM="Tetraselmis astigmatica, Strain CCMP880" /LENGTH=122 /DNA_ID=CAMNT_0005510209 /DNA_START=434 /DNA_END=798 /DNA_ORIENTATION=+
MAHASEIDVDLARMNRRLMAAEPGILDRVVKLASGTVLGGQESQNCEMWSTDSNVDLSGRRQRSYNAELQRLALVVLSNFAGDSGVADKLEAAGAVRVLESTIRMPGLPENVKQQAATVLQA